MYKKFKQSLINEMEQRRDLLIAKESASRVVPLFEISDLNDKLYNKIIKDLERTAIIRSEVLLNDLCKKHNIKSKLLSSAAEASIFDLMISINSKDAYVDIKTSPQAFYGSKMEQIVKKYSNYESPIYLIFLLKNDVEGRQCVEDFKENYPKNKNVLYMHPMLFEDFLLKLFGQKELDEFEKEMSTFKEEMHQALGFQITELLNDNNRKRLTEELEKVIINFHYDKIKAENYTILKKEYPDFKDIYDKNYNKIKNQFLHEGRYKVLLGDSDYAKSFLTSEWFYKKYVFLEELDNTFIVSGYLKSIEQLLWNIIDNDTKKRYTLNRSEDEIDTTLGNLIYFLGDYDNKDLFDSKFVDDVFFVIRYVTKQMNYWRKYRNIYFHKDVLKEKEKVEEIRNKTFFLYLLILGTIKIK